MTTSRSSVVLSSDQLEGLAEGIVRGQYNLLLGAGASMDAQNRRGDTLPSAMGLANQFIADFGLPADENELSLSTAYEEALHGRTVDGATMSAYLKDRFTECRPAEWHRILARMTWKRIWTLNIDDVVEQAYASCRERRQSSHSINWTDGHDDAAPGTVQIVHLHGRAWGRDPFVFSVAEYLQATSESHAWHRIFGDHFQDQPFIVLGATLMDEYDLAAILRRGSASFKSRGQPSYIVLKKIRPVQRQQFERANLIPIEMSAGSFVTGLFQAVSSTERRLQTFVPGGSRDQPLDTRARIFLNQFQWLSLDYAARTSTRDFYAGYDPEWADILSENDAIFEVVREVVSSLENVLPGADVSQRLELLHGPWGSGKSTALLRIGRELIRHGLDIYLFRGETRPDVEAITWWLSASPRTLLLFDGVADHADDIADLLVRGKRSGVSVLIAGAEREKRLRQVMNSVSPEFLQYRGPRLMRSMNQTDIQVLLAKLESKSRLGRLTRKNKAAQIKYFSQAAKGQLFVGMSDLEGGTGFLQRFRREVGGESLDSKSKIVLGLTGITHHFGYPLPISIATAASGLESPKLLAMVESGSLQELVMIKPQGLQLRHRHLASMLIRGGLPIQDRYKLTQLLAKNLAPHSDYAAITQRSLVHKITKNLFDHNSVRMWAGSRAEEWYSELESLFGWNARFWEQRALALIRVNQLDKARSFAETALKIHKDVFTLTTLGNIALRQVVGALSAGNRSIFDDYWGAVELLRQARDKRQTADDHSFSVFFNQSIQIAELLLSSTGLPDDFVGEVNDWFAEAKRNPTFAYTENRKRLDRFQREWWRLLTSRAS